MNITTQIRLSPQHKPDLMGLPYEGALSRALERRRVEEEERERAKAAKLDADKAARLDDLQDRAARQIGDEAESWLTTANEKRAGSRHLPLRSTKADIMTQSARLPTRFARMRNCSVRVNARTRP